MLRPLAALLLALAWNGARAQPYLDVVNTAGYISPHRFEKYDVNMALPIPIGKQGARLVFSPGVERWNARADSAAQQRTGCAHEYALPVTLLAPLGPRSVDTIGRRYRPVHGDRGFRARRCAGSAVRCW